MIRGLAARQSPIATKVSGGGAFANSFGTTTRPEISTSACIGRAGGGGGCPAIGGGLAGAGAGAGAAVGAGVQAGAAVSGAITARTRRWWFTQGRQAVVLCAIRRSRSWTARADC